MKNKFNKILLIISFVLVIITLLLTILGSVNRIGYLSEFKLNKDLSKKNAYYYDFRLKYYSKIFRNNDIFNVIFDVPQFAYVGKNLIEFKNITFDKKGSSPFCNFISTRELQYDDKIQGINYKLKLKIPIWLVFIIVVTYILFNYKLIIDIFKEKKEIIIKVSKISSVSILAILVLLFILGKLNHKASLEDLELVAESEAGYIYRARVVSKGLFSENAIYKYNNILKFENKPEYIKNYGYNINLKLVNHKNKNGSIYNNPDKTVTISNDNNYYSILGYDIEPSVGEKYIVTLEAKKIGNISGNIKYQLDDINKNIVIPNTDKITDKYEKYISTLDIEYGKRAIKPVMRFYYPTGTINVRYLNIQQVSDNLYLKSGNSIIFTSSKKIDNVNNIGKINYQLYINNYLLVIGLLALIFIIFIHREKIISYKNILNHILIQNKQLIRNLVIISIAVFIFIIIITAFLGKQDRTGYLSDFNLVSSKNGEYTYNFKIKYYSKIFINSNIYDVYPYLNNLPNYIKSAKMDDRFGTPFGSLISEKELKYDDKIDTQYYLMINFDIFYYIVIIMIIILLCMGYYLLKEYWKYKKTLDKNDYLFVNKIEIIGILLFAFQYWLFYPGNFNFYDLYYSIFYGLFNASDNWHPVFIDLSIKFLDKIGFTMMPLFFINMLLWYLGLSIIIIGLYLKFKNKYVILLFLINYLYIVFFNNANYFKDFTATLYLFFSCSIIIFMSLIPINNGTVKNILKISSLLTLIISMMHRHTFIVTIYPILIWFTYDYLKTKNIKNIKKYLFSFAAIMFVNAIILMGIYFIFPRLFIKNINSSTSYHIYLLQIAGCIVPANDKSLIPEYMYRDGKDFNDFKNEYYKNKTFADNFRGIIKYDRKIKIIWIKSILKYPINYIKHIFNFSKALLIQKYTAFNSKYIQDYPYKNKIERLFTKSKISETGEEFYNSKWYKENSGIKFTNLREKIYILLSNVLPNFNIILHVLIVVLLFIIISILIIKKHIINDILVLSFSISFSGISTIIVNCLFLPAATVNQSYRYIYPIVHISILLLILFISFIYDRGGFKKFIKELRGDEK